MKRATEVTVIERRTAADSLGLLAADEVGLAREREPSAGVGRSTKTNDTNQTKPDLGSV